MTISNSLRKTITERRNSLISGVDEVVSTTADVEKFEKENGDYVMVDQAEAWGQMMEPINVPTEVSLDEEEGEENSADQVSHSTSSASTANSLQSFEPEKSQDSDVEKDAGTGSSLPALVKTGTRYFSPHMKGQRKRVCFQFIKINFFLMIYIFIIFGIFWGALYKTKPYLHKVDILTVIKEDPIVPGMDNVTMPMTAALPMIIDQVPGHWHVYNSSTFAAKYKISEDPIEIAEKIRHLIYKEVFWLGVDVKPNVTQNLFNALTNKSLASFNSSANFDLVFEGARDLTSMTSVIVPLGLALESAFSEFFSNQYLPSMLKNITASDINPFNLAMSGNMNWSQVDFRPFENRILLTVIQIGCAYCTVLTLFQFLVYGPMHVEMAKMLRFKSRVVYRFLIAALTHFFLALFFCTVTAMFQVDFTKAFGRGGFMVYWMSTWLFMWAVGGANENMVGVIFAIAPQCVGFWILGFVSTNICTGFFPLALNSAFYRFGYFMPVHNIVDIYRVIFLDTSRWKMGRNYGVLIAWIVINTVTLPFFMKMTSRLIIKHMKKEAAAKAAEAQKDAEAAATIAAAPAQAS